MTPALEQSISSHLLDVTTGEPHLVPVLADGTVLWSIPIPADRPPTGRRLIGITSQLGLEHAEDWLGSHPNWICSMEQPSARLAELSIDVP